MRDVDLLGQALGLMAPWYAERSTFDAETRRLDIYIDFRRGGTFRCPECGRDGCKAYDTADKVWRHLNFFEHKAYLHVRTPRVECALCGVKLVEVPWARHGSGFTLLFEAWILILCREMPVAAVARQLGEHDTRLWRVLEHYVEEAREAVDYAGVRRIGVDETASKRGHHYISVFVDLEERRVLYATEGRDAGVFGSFRRDLEAHGGCADAIEEISMDMSPAQIKGAREQFPDAAVTYDKFHVVKLLNEAVEEVRRREQRSRPELKTSRWTWTKNPSNWTKKQKETYEALSLPRLNLKTARAYRLKLAFQELYEQPLAWAEEHLRRWYGWAIRSRLPEIKAVARTIKRHWDGILRWFDSRLTTAVLEAINSLIQAARARARGYRSPRTMITMLYLLAAKLDLRPLRRLLT